jgi:hypothetical protein
MDNASRNDETAHANWVKEVDKRIGELIATGNFHPLEPNWVPMRLIALATGYMREVPSAGRRGKRIEFRVELLQRGLRTSLTPGTEWLTIKQIAELTKRSRSAVASEYEEWASCLYTDRETTAVVDGELAASIDCLSPVEKAKYYGEKWRH